MPIKRYAPEIGKLWVDIAKRCITIAERELYEIYSKTIGIHSQHPQNPWTIIEQMYCHRFFRPLSKPRL